MQFKEVILEVLFKTICLYEKKVSWYISSLMVRKYKNEASVSVNESASSVN